LLVVDDLTGDRSRLLRVALRVELLQDHLAVGVLLVILVDCKPDTPDCVEPEIGSTPRQRTDEPELKIARLAGSSFRLGRFTTGCAAGAQHEPSSRECCCPY